MTLKAPKNETRNQNTQQVQNTDGTECFVRFGHKNQPRGFCPFWQSNSRIDKNSSIDSLKADSKWLLIKLMWKGLTGKLMKDWNVTRMMTGFRHYQGPVAAVNLLLFLTGSFTFGWKQLSYPQNFVKMGKIAKKRPLYFDFWLMFIMGSVMLLV